MFDLTDEVAIDNFEFNNAWQYALHVEPDEAYSEVVFRQTTEDFIRAIENAFHHFRGVPKTLVVDNLKAAVIKPDHYDPDLNPKRRAYRGGQRSR